MKRVLMLFLIGVPCLGASWAAYQTTVPEEPPLSRYVPAGALLYIQAKDFSSLLADWDGSSEKKQWVKSDNYEVFSRSRLFLRLKEASDKFTATAGLPPDMNFLHQVAGPQSALALFDIGKLQFLYITRLPSANAMQSTLWQTRSKFETRNANGASFFYRRDPESETEVAFAVSGEYLILATREDLMAGALELINGGKERSIEAEEWWSQAASASPAGDLRMVLNLEKIVPSPYFRSYWIQRNITEMKQYSAAVSDVFRSGREYKEERVLIRKAGANGEAQSVGETGAVAELIRLVPAQTGMYALKANPTPAQCFALLETKILAPHLGPAPAEQLAPQVQLASGETGSGSDLETRIDQAPVQQTVSSDNSAAIKSVFEKNRVRGVLQVQSTERDKGGVFVRIHSGVVLLADSDWDENAVRAALVDLVRPGFTAGQLGVEWLSASGFQQLNGLWALAAAVRGKYLFVSDDPATLSEILANMNKRAAPNSAIYAAGFNHSLERDNFSRFNALLESASRGTGSSMNGGRVPDFFSDNIGSLSSTLKGVSSEKIRVRETSDKVFQTVTYEWAR
jgi:hypothetical protein